jgi:CheB methylesterase
MRGTGGVTMAQSEATSLYFDMPRAAIDLGGSQIRFSPHKIAEGLCAVGRLNGASRRAILWGNRTDRVVIAGPTLFRMIATGLPDAKPV